MLEWEQSSQQFQSNTLCSVTALRAKSLYKRPKTAVLTSEELCCSDMTPVRKHVLCFQMTVGVFWLFFILFFCEWVSFPFSRQYCGNLSRLKQIWWHVVLVYISQVFKWLSITLDGLLVTVNAHSSDSICIDAKRTLKKKMWASFSPPIYFRLWILGYLATLSQYWHMILYICSDPSIKFSAWQNFDELM